MLSLALWRIGRMRRYSPLQYVYSSSKIRHIESPRLFLRFLSALPRSSMRLTPLQCALYSNEEAFFRPVAVHVEQIMAFFGCTCQTCG